MNINIAILEDMPAHYKSLSDFLQTWALKNGHIIYVNWFRNGNSIIGSNIINKCDLLFSDIELSNSSNNDFTSNDETNGIQVCSELRNNGFHGDIIFLTAFREYVFEGYQAKAINYLLKPITYNSIEQCMEKYISMHCLDFYYFHRDNDIIRIPYNDIISVSRTGHDCYINTMQTLYTERNTLKHFEKHLPDNFIRCHKSCIVNITHVVSLLGSTIRLSNKQNQPVGRVYIDNVRKKLLDLAADNHI